MIKRSPGCKCCQPTICVTATGCHSNAVLGATVTVKQGATTIGTCTTAGEVSALTLSAGGSGYTNGTGYALGFSGGTPTTAATGTFDVVSGAVTNLQLTGGGSGYDEIPAISFPGAGAGTGASGTATLIAKCCVVLPASGSYDVSVAKAGYTTYTTTGVSVTGTTNVSASLSVSTAHCCSWCTFEIPATLYVTDANGTHTMTWDGVDSWIVCYTFSGTIAVVDVTLYDGTDCSDIYTQAGTVAVRYVLKCNPGVGTPAGQASLFQEWTACRCIPSSGPHPAVREFGGGTVLGSGAGCSIAGAPVKDESVLIFNVTENAASTACNPVAVSFTFPATITGGDPVPGAGTVAVSA